MKTREEIEQEYLDGCRAVWAVYEPKLDAISKAEAAELDALAEKRKAALAELDDPMLRLIAAAKKWHDNHWLSFGACSHSVCVDLRDAIREARRDARREVEP